MRKMLICSSVLVGLSGGMLANAAIAQDVEVTDDALDRDRVSGSRLRGSTSEISILSHETEYVYETKVSDIHYWTLGYEVLIADLTPYVTCLLKYPPVPANAASAGVLVPGQKSASSSSAMYSFQQPGIKHKTR